jgi:hyperosmotically inducible periplasmic protein
MRARERLANASRHAGREAGATQNINFNEGFDMKTIFISAVTALALLTGTGCTVMRDQQSAGSYVDDTAITTKVKAKFAEDKTVSAMAIQVETLKGTVQLSGFAKSVDEKLTAERLARSVNGVQDVKNDIVVRA